MWCPPEPAVPIVASPVALMTKSRSETKLPGTDLLVSMVCRLAPGRLAGCVNLFPALGGLVPRGVDHAADPGGPDHDQRLKVLLKEFFEAFFLCFFPAWAARFEFTEIDWLDKELFLAPPQGEKRQLDLVAQLQPAARLRRRPRPTRPIWSPWSSMSSWRSRASTPAFRPRMFDYTVQLQRVPDCPVLRHRPVPARRARRHRLGRLRRTLLGTADRPLRVRIRRTAGPGRRAVRDG